MLWKRFARAARDLIGKSDSSLSDNTVGRPYNNAETNILAEAAKAQKNMTESSFVPGDARAKAAEELYRHYVEYNQKIESIKRLEGSNKLRKLTAVEVDGNKNQIVESQAREIFELPGSTQFPVELGDHSGALHRTVHQLSARSPSRVPTPPPPYQSPRQYTATQLAATDHHIVTPLSNNGFSEITGTSTSAASLSVNQKTLTRSNTGTSARQAATANRDKRDRSPAPEL